jgi:DNA-binding transcriptional ArsR family regulator
MASTGPSTEKDFHKALQHPLRRRILRVARSRDMVSPKGISDKLDEPLSNVSYHVRILKECGAIELVDTSPVRGSVEHFYSFTVDAKWALAALRDSNDG